MDSLISKVQSIELKVRKLTLLLEQYETDCALLKDENHRLKQSLAKYEGVSSESTIVELAAAIPTAAVSSVKENRSNEALKAKVDKYIKEVDKCIELVNSW